MSFKQRQINLIFSIDGQEVYLEGLRSQAIISNPGGNNAAASLQLVVYGMTLEHMNKYSSTGSSTVAGALALGMIVFKFTVLPFIRF